MKTNLPSSENIEKKSEVGFFANQAGEFHNLMNHFWNYMDMPLKNSFSDLEPKIEVAENKNNVMVTAELPGIDEKDLELKVSSDGYLTISGEKKEKNHAEEKGSCFSEISYGMFKRTIPLPTDINFDSAVANYSDGLLTVTLPKLPKEKQKAKVINITKTNA